MSRRETLKKSWIFENKKDLIFVYKLIKKETSHKYAYLLKRSFNEFCVFCYELSEAKKYQNCSLA